MHGSYQPKPLFRKRDLLKLLSPYHWIKAIRKDKQERKRIAAERERERMGVGFGKCPTTIDDPDPLIHYCKLDRGHLGPHDFSFGETTGKVD